VNGILSDAIWAIQYVWEGVTPCHVTLDEEIIGYLCGKSNMKEEEYKKLQEEWTDTLLILVSSNEKRTYQCM
jgi:hypothetical protein